MDSHGVRRLPVADEAGEPIGMICLDDLYNYLTQEAITLFGTVRVGPTTSASIDRARL